MNTSAIITMLVGIVIIWGGSAASIIHMVRTERANKRKDS
ncbi:hypothetical protein BH20ACT9_BH20ACT9_10650 [soil metagenome]